MDQISLNFIFAGVRTKQALGIFVSFMLAVSVLAKPACGQGSRADYERWETYVERTRDRIRWRSVEPHWLGPESSHFWYQLATAPGEHEFVLVDAVRGKRWLAFDHAALANALNDQLAERAATPQRLELRDLTFAEDAASCDFVFRRRLWRYELPTGPLTDRGPAPGLVPLNRVVVSRERADRRVSLRFENRLQQPLRMIWVTPDGDLRSYGQIEAASEQEISTYAGHTWVLANAQGSVVAAFSASQATDRAVIDRDTPRPKALSLRRVNRRRRTRRPGWESPDKRWRVSFADHNLIVSNLESEEEVARTSDGSGEDSYDGRVWWSPDSRHFVVMKTRPGEQRQISMIEAAPRGSIHSRVVTIDYAKPGDRLDRPRPVLFSVGDWEPRVIDDALFSHPFSLRDLRWHESSAGFSFLYNQRGHQRLRLISVDAQTAVPRLVIDEVSETFICYSSKTFLRRLDKSDEILWMSERSGWNHLYLIDARSGAVKSPITTGEWVVREVEHVDEERRQLWLRVGGFDRDQDPYHVHLIRVNFDGSGLTQLTPGDGYHRWRFSPDRRYLIDRYSRVDLPPVTQLVDAQSGERICQLESADASDLLATGWRPPQRFVAKGRDGTTDIHGIIVRPTNFDPRKRYPILEAIYAGPHSAFVPKEFGTHRGLYEMAELGFIVVKMDGMGTSHRSKAFHDVCWKNLGDSGFPDRISWIKAAAGEHPEMDLSRIGIWGGSAGGQSAMRALIAHGDFYHAASADCGCHDNRVDKIWWNEQWMGWPIGDHYAQQSNVTQAHRLRGELLLIWGELDRNVDPASSMQVGRCAGAGGQGFRASNHARRGAWRRRSPLCQTAAS